MSNEDLNAFYPEGAGWRLKYRGQGTWVDSSTGMPALHRLIAAPGEPITVEELESPAPAPRFGSDPVLDKKSAKSLRARLEAVQEALEEASGEVQAELEEERKQILSTLHRSKRPLDTQRDKCRNRVRKNLRNAIDKIARHLQALGAHLEESIRGMHGYRPCYQPITPMRWTLQRTALGGGT